MRAGGPLSDYVSDQLINNNLHRLVHFNAPSLAPEVSCNCHTALTVASKHVSLAPEVQPPRGLDHRLEAHVIVVQR